MTAICKTGGLWRLDETGELTVRLRGRKGRIGKLLISAPSHSREVGAVIVPVPAPRSIWLWSFGYLAVDIADFKVPQ